jgi:mono/diheme cytochrome c family protein
MSTNLERFFVPALHLVAISGLAFTLIVVVISRSPYTHGNLNPEGYDRTEIAVLGQSYPYDRLKLADPGRTITGDAARDGSFIFIEQSCALCHGSKGQGGAVGPKLKSDYSISQLQHAVREPTGGMPSYSETAVSNDAIEKVLAFLKSR